MTALYDAVADVVSARFGIDRDKVSLDATFDDLGLDSLSQFELATVLKKRFGANMSDDEMTAMSSVSDVVDWLEKKGVMV